jgi:general stress protein 26
MEKAVKEIIDYSLTKEKLYSFLSSPENSVMILATSADDIVMARPVLVINYESDIYFFTWKHSRKYIQIKKNNNVSICKDKVEIEGKAEILGLMTDEKNLEIMNIMRKKQPESIEKWENKPNMVIIKVKPQFACVDGYFLNDNAYIEYIDFNKQTAHKEKWGNF